MANMIDYLAWRGDLPVEKIPLGEADLLVLSRLAYLPLEGLVGEEPVPLGEVMERLSPLLGDGEGQRRPLIRGDLALAPALADSPRFASLFLARYENVFDPARDIQFAAVTVLLPRLTVVSFRGTDGTIVGWKEDFHLNFAEAVPAQKAAVAYLVETARRYPGPLMVTGHSKGGNLAVYAAAFAPADVKRRVRAVRSHDGPGFPDSVTEKAAYAAILPCVKSFLPQSSVVGMLMNHREETQIIRSSERALMQHDPYTWEIVRDGFEQVGSLTAGSIFVDRAVKDWVREVPPAELEAAVDAVFGVLESGDAVRFRDLWTGKSARAILRALKNQDPATREVVKKALKYLGSAVKETGIKTGEEWKKNNQEKQV